MKDNSKKKIYLDIYYSIEANSRDGLNWDKFQRNRLRSKSQECNQIAEENLIAFISDKNKFYMSPIFDQEGSKKFLQSKYSAMEKIILDDDIENLKPKNNHYKRTHASGSNLKSCADLKRVKLFNQKNSNNFKETYFSSTKNTHNHKKKSSKFENKVTSAKAVALCLTLNDSEISDELKVQKKHRKNKNGCNEFELKMFKDKNIKNLEPIDDVNKNGNHHHNKKKNKDNNNYNSKYPFIENDAPNSSIEIIISEMQRTNAY